MPIVIGGKPESSFADPIGLLADCHRRIERFLGVLVHVSRQAEPLTDDQRTSLETALRYFREAAPKHTADEEQTLFPRLRACDRPEVQAIMARMDTLEEQHAQAEQSHAEVDRIGQALLAAGTLSPEDAARFSDLTAELQNLYREHISFEEREVFPVAAVVLGKPEREVIGGEMAARRGIA